MSFGYKFKHPTFTLKETKMKTTIFATFLSLLSIGTRAELLCELGESRPTYIDSKSQSVMFLDNDEIAKIKSFRQYRGGKYTYRIEGKSQEGNFTIQTTPTFRLTGEERRIADLMEADALMTFTNGAGQTFKSLCNSFSL